LEVALARLLVAREGRLRLLVLELVEDLAVRDVTHLEVLMHELAVLEANTALAIGHQSITGLIGLAHIAVDALPPVFAITRLRTASGCSIAPVGERIAEGFRAILAPKAWGTYALAVRFAAFGKLLTSKILEVAVEARRASIWPVVHDREERCFRQLYGGIIAIRSVS
jgi:hypothetical protein